MDIYSLFTLFSEEERKNLVSQLDNKLNLLIKEEKDEAPSMKNMVEIPELVEDLVEFADQLGVKSIFTPEEVSDN